MNMAAIVKLAALDGCKVELVPEIKAYGAVKDVYFSPDRQYVVAFFRKYPSAAAMDRMENIVGPYRKMIFEGAGGKYWEKLFCWPRRLVEWDGRLGFVSPVYDPVFFFNSGRFSGREKEGKWFASARLRNRFLEPAQKGDWLKHLQICLNIARAVRRLHAAGLAHSDLSYKNVLVDPQTGRACVIDIDGLVVPGKYPPDVVGTPDFIAPEVMATRALASGSPLKKLPSIYTDRHALAVLIYMYLLYRHPLRGPRTLSADPVRDEELCMGSRALFIEHPSDCSNRPRAALLDEAELPQADVDRLPCTVTGPYLSALFGRAFVDGLHEPEARPTASDWEAALVRTIDLLQPCQNSACQARWFVFDGDACCPFCGTRSERAFPVLDFYWSPKKGVFRQENHRLAVYDRQSLYMWHASRNVAPNEKTGPEDKKPVGDFHFHNGSWILVNRRLPAMYDKTDDVKIEPGSAVTLESGKRILLADEPGGRLVLVLSVNGRK